MEVVGEGMWLLGGCLNFRGAASAGRGMRGEVEGLEILHIDTMFASCLVYCINMVIIVHTEGAGGGIHYGGRGARGGSIGETVGERIMN